MKVKQLMACLNTTENITITMKRSRQEISIAGSDREIRMDRYYQEFKELDIAIIFVDERGIDIWV